MTNQQKEICKHKKCVRKYFLLLQKKEDCFIARAQSFIAL